MLMSCCAYSCTQYGLLTQYMLLTHADALLCLQLHAAGSDYFLTFEVFIGFAFHLFCSMSFLFVFSYSISYFYPSSSSSKAINSRSSILSTLMPQTQLSKLRCRVINTKYICRSQLHSPVLSTAL